MKLKDFLKKHGPHAQPMRKNIPLGVLGFYITQKELKQVTEVTPVGFGGGLTLMAWWCVWLTVGLDQREILRFA
jgi:hypothetical protein